jgi:hypothetical protein
MGFFDMIGNAVSSGLAFAGDIVETVVETVVDPIQNAISTGAEAVKNGVNAAVDWVVQNTDMGFVGEIIKGVAIFVGAGINQFITTVSETLIGALDIVIGIGRIVGSLLRLDLPGLLQAVLDVFIGIGKILVISARGAVFGTFFGEVVNSYQRNELKTFVEDLLADSFGPRRLVIVRNRLNMDSVSWGLRCNVHHKVFTIDSRNFTTLAQLHRNGEIDLYAMAGVLSTDSLDVFQVRYNVKYITEDGSESLIPATRYHISQFLENGAPHLKIYATDTVELRDAMNYADRHYLKAGIRFNWNQSFWFPKQQIPEAFEITTREQLFMVASPKSGTSIDAFLVSSGLKPVGENNLTIRSQTSFKLFFEEDMINGVVSGRSITEEERENEENWVFIAGCDITPQTVLNRVPVGAGVTTRQVFPNYFSKIVLSHELGHYFGLCHVAHDGVQNIMFSLAAGNHVLDIGMFRFYLDSEPDFSFEDRKNMWRFIINKLGNEL